MQYSKYLFSVPEMESVRKLLLSISLPVLFHLIIEQVQFIDASHRN